MAISPVALPAQNRRRLAPAAERGSRVGTTVDNKNKRRKNGDPIEGADLRSGGGCNVKRINTKDGGYAGRERRWGSGGRRIK